MFFWKRHATQAVLLFLFLQIYEATSEPTSHQHINLNYPSDSHHHVFRRELHEDSAPVPRGMKEKGDPGRYKVVKKDFAKVSTPFIVAMYILFIGVAKIGYHIIPVLPEFIPESSFLITLGIILGICMYYSTRKHDGTTYEPIYVLGYIPTIFFYYLLPPIILDAGYFMPNRLFFDHLGTILLMAVVGTALNAVTIGFSLWGCGMSGSSDGGPGLYTFHDINGTANTEPLNRLEVLLFASLISAVDPVAVLAVFDEVKVNEVLYIVVFGESLLNDGVTVVLFNMFIGFLEIYNEQAKKGIPQQITAGNAFGGIGNFFIVALGGTAWGIAWGLLCGFITRFTYHARVIEPVFVFAIGYIAYFNAEMLEWSSILSITFCGITMKNYVLANVSRNSQVTIQYSMKMMSNIAECLVFLLLGIEAVRDDHDWDWAFVCLTILFCSVYRIVVVAFLAFLANRFRILKLEIIEQYIMMYGGLRGAVAYYMVSSINQELVPAKKLYMTTTLAVIYFTVFFQGITVKPLVKWLRVKRAQPRDRKLNERIHEKAIDHAMACLERVAGNRGDNFIRIWFKYYEEKWLRPLLIREKIHHEPTIMRVFENVQIDDAMQYVEGNAKRVDRKKDDDSSSSDSSFEAPRPNYAARQSIVADLLDVDFPIPGIDTFNEDSSSRPRTFTVDSRTGLPSGLEMPWNSGDYETDTVKKVVRQRKISVSPLAVKEARAMSQPMVHPHLRPGRFHSMTPTSQAFQDIQNMNAETKTIPVGMVKPEANLTHQKRADLSKIDGSDSHRKERTMSAGSVAKQIQRKKQDSLPRHQRVGHILAQEGGSPKTQPKKRGKAETGSFKRADSESDKGGVVNPAFEDGMEMQSVQPPRYEDLPKVAPRRQRKDSSSSSSSSD